MTQKSGQWSILVVEDEKALREVYELILTNAGYSVSTAIDGQQALVAVKETIPDFILLDVFMPVMNGLEFMRALNEQSQHDVPIVVFSNNSDSGVREEAYQLGAKDVVLKSDVSPADLVALVEGYIAKS